MFLSEAAFLEQMTVRTVAGERIQLHLGSVCSGSDKTI
jgi:hypothetical protein